jgi:hypothetical protein
MIFRTFHNVKTFVFTANESFSYTETVLNLSPVKYLNSYDLLLKKELWIKILEESLRFRYTRLNQNGSYHL